MVFSDLYNVLDWISSMLGWEEKRKVLQDEASIQRNVKMQQAKNVTNISSVRMRWWRRASNERTM